VLVLRLLVERLAALRAVVVRPALRVLVAARRPVERPLAFAALVAARVLAGVADDGVAGVAGVLVTAGAGAGLEAAELEAARAGAARGAALRMSS